MADEKEDKVVDPFDKHIDLAIEAQDANPTQDTDVEEGKESKSEDKSQQQSNAGESGDGDNAAQQKSDEEGKKEQKPAHGPKDLVLRGQGEGGTDLVVKAGMERRFYEQRELARQQVRERDSQIERLNSELEKARSQAESVSNSVKSIHGVEPQQLALGVKIVSDLQRDPAGTIKKLLTEAASQGINIESVGVGVDMTAIQRMIDERIPKQNANQQTEEQIIAEATQEAEQFFASHPDARPHDALLSKILRDYPDLSLQDAYFQIKNAFIEKGFDFALSLEDNLKQMSDSQTQNNNGGDNQQQPNNGKAPLPSGGNGAGSDFRSADLTNVADDSMDMGDIVRQAMKEEGYKV